MKQVFASCIALMLLFVFTQVFADEKVKAVEKAAKPAPVAAAEPVAEVKGEPSAEAVAAEDKNPMAEKVDDAKPVAEAPAEPEKKVDEAAELLKKSDTLWRTRQEKGNDRKSILAAEQAMEKGAAEFEGLFRVARGCFWVAENSPDKKEKINFGQKGWDAGKKAAELKPKSVEGWYWGVVSMGQYSKGIGIGKAFFKGISGKFENMAENALKLDKKYGYGGPSRAYGRYWHQVPWPKRNYERSEKLLRESESIYPQKLRTQFYLAELYLSMDQKDKAKQALDKCLALDPMKEEVPDGLIYKKECEKLKSKEFK